MAAQIISGEAALPIVVMLELERRGRAMREKRVDSAGMVWGHKWGKQARVPDSRYKHYI